MYRLIAAFFAFLLCAASIKAEAVQSEAFVVHSAKKPSKCVLELEQIVYAPDFPVRRYLARVANEMRRQFPFIVSNVAATNINIFRTYEQKYGVVITIVSPFQIQSSTTSFNSYPIYITLTNFYRQEQPDMGSALAQTWSGVNDGFYISPAQYVSGETVPLNGWANYETKLWTAEGNLMTVMISIDLASITAY